MTFDWKSKWMNSYGKKYLDDLENKAPYRECKVCHIRKKLMSRYFFRNKVKKGEVNPKGFQSVCRECIANMRMQREVDPRSRMLLRSRSNAKTKGVPHTIKWGEIELPTYCRYLGVKLDYSAAAFGHARRPFGASFDRIVPSLGYVKGNVQVISELANRMKTNATVEEMLAFAEGVLIAHGGKSKRKHKVPIAANVVVKNGVAETPYHGPITDIFVFGSNTQGRHAKEGAATAREEHGAIYGQPRGLQGDSYGIATKELRGGYPTVTVDDIAKEVEEFCTFAESTKSRFRFFVTPIGCGLSGFTPGQIAPMFIDAPDNVVLPQEFIGVLGESGTSYDDSVNEDYEDNNDDYPLADMKVDQSFFRATDESGIADTVQRIKSACQSYVNQNRGTKFSIRKVEGGVRCLRTA